MARPRKNSETISGTYIDMNGKSQHVKAYHKVIAPYHALYSDPRFQENTKTEIIDSDGNIIYDGKKVLQLHGFCLQNNIDKAITELRSQGWKNVTSESRTERLPINCPVCDKKGIPNFLHNDRRKNTRWILSRDIPINLYYYHGEKRCYCATWKYGVMKWSPKITDIRKTMPFGYLGKNQNST